MIPDPASIARKTLDVAEHAEVLVVGGGCAGIKAALDARRQGATVVLVDENPVAPETMGDDIPMLWGGTGSGAVRNRNAIIEALLAARPGLTEAFEAGVDVRLGTSCWGVYANGPAVSWLSGPVAGLADASHAWMIGFQHIVVAAGCRDMGIAFAGWDLPGVAGVQAAARLASLRAFAPRRAVLLGTSEAALGPAESLAEAGVAIVAVIEAAAEPLTDTGHLGAPVLCGQRVIRAEGGLDGVRALVVASVRGELRLECDAVLLGIGTVPVIELLDAAGCRIVFDPWRGHVPLLDEVGRTTLPFISAVGGCAGKFPAQPGLAAYRTAWVERLVVDGAHEVHVCRCEEVTAQDILHLRPPRYLRATPSPCIGDSLCALLDDGPPNPDWVKRLTRAGMGVCQGRRCREQVACLLALGTGAAPDDVPLATHRPPVRPLPLRFAQGVAEPDHMRRNWDTWFGMYSQYLPYWDAAPTYTATNRPRDPDRAQ